MLFPKISPPNPPSSPPFDDAAGCRRWLAGLPLANVLLAHGELANQLGRLNGHKLDPRDRLAILETLREPLAFLQQERAKKYQLKPLPLDPLEEAAWNGVISLWQTMEAGYRLCLPAYTARGESEAGSVARITQRRLRYTGLQMMEHYRAYRQVPLELWQQLHGLYAFAEERGLGTHPVEDALNSQAESNHCAAAYAQALLTDLADPYRLTSRQLVLLERWLARWAGRVAVLPEPPRSSAPLIRVEVDLGGDAGPVAGEHPPMLTPRYLDTEQLALTFRKRIKALRNGDSPERLGLGADCVQPGCETLLVSLYQHWCEVGIKRRTFGRHPGTAPAQVVAGMEAIHYFLSGEKPFRPPNEPARLSRREMEDLAMYGRISSLTEKALAQQQGFALETWLVLDESALGFRLARRGDGLRLNHGQLLAVRPEDSKGFILGVIQWLESTVDRDLHAGVRALPGAPLAVAARPVPPDPGPFVQAFLLPEMTVLNQPESLVLPGGWFQPGRKLEIFSDKGEMVRLHELIEAGNGYERVGFVRV